VITFRDVPEAITQGKREQDGFGRPGIADGREIPKVRERRGAND
jgi:hypothetical protein